MKKLTKVLTTSLIALTLMMAAPAAMADKPSESGVGLVAQNLCYALGLDFENQGRCVSFIIDWLKT